MRGISLKNICQITMGQAPPGTSYNEKREGLALIAGAGDFGKITPEPHKFTTNPSRKSSIGDIILCIRATIGDTNWSDKPYCLGREVAGLQPNPVELDSNYLWYWIGANKKSIARHAKGSTFKQIKKEDIENLKIPLLPLPEQKRIAAILDKADVIRRKRQTAIKLADDFLRATFLDMFGDPVTNPKGWKVVPLGKLCRVRRGASPRPIAKFLGGNVPWIKIGDGTKNDSIYIEDTKDKIIQDGVCKSVYLEPGSLIFANCGMSLGFARIVKMAGCIHDGWLSFDQFDEHLNEIYLLKALNSVTNYFRQIAPDGTQPNLNTTIMKNFRLQLPPKKLQERFSDIVLKLQENNQIVKRSANNLTDLFNSLTQRAFRGEL